jgi:hypothetical protein
MAKLSSSWSFLDSPDHMDKAIQEIMEDPKIKDIIEQANRTKARQIPAKLKEEELRFHKAKLEYEQRSKGPDPEEGRKMFEIWYTFQIARYRLVRKASKNYLKSNNKLLPPERSDFMSWFVKYAKETGDYLSQNIDVHHFIKYHDYLVQAINNPLKWTGLFNELQMNGYIKTTKEIFIHVMAYKQLPPGCNQIYDKIRWHTFKADAHYFREKINFSVPEFNKCFQSEDGRPFAHGSKSETKRNKKLTDIIGKCLT